MLRGGMVSTGVLGDSYGETEALASVPAAQPLGISKRTESPALPKPSARAK